MDCTVILTFTRGPLAGQKYVFDEATTCLIGRSRDCTIALPLEFEHQDVSRRHCLLEIESDFVRIRDLGSLNGTYVNGRKIGQRSAHLAPVEVARLFQPAVALIDDDEIRLGEHTAFRMHIIAPERKERARVRRHSSGELHFELTVP